MSSRSFGSAAKLSPPLAARIGDTEGRTKVVAFLDVGRQPLTSSATYVARKARVRGTHADLVRQLRETGSGGSSFVSFIRSLADSGYVDKITPFWITDAVSFTADSRSLERIADHPELRYLIEDQPLQLVDPVYSGQSLGGYSGSNPALTLTGVRGLWNRGFTGHGRLVCSFDTGVEGTHPALIGGWVAADNRAVSQGWFDPYGTTFPTDNNGHGTHTMGIMVGRDSDDTIGVAFNARWMSAAVIDRGQSLSKTISDILAAFQWVADPDGDPETVEDLPDVLCNSWGIPRGLFEPCDQTFWQAIDNLEALGIVVIFACGNEGPNPETIRNPADRATSPTNSFSVGAVNQTQPDLPVAPFSSRGPSTCDATKIKPEIVAPGVTIRSCYRGGTYRVMSGTSMAAPFVAGCVALMREYNPEATVEQIKYALIQSAIDLGATGKDNDYGFGFIDVSRAVEYLPEPQKPRISVESVRLAESDDGILAVGNTTTLELSLSNTVALASELKGKLRCAEPHAYVLVDSALFGTVAAGGTTDNYGSPFLVKLDHNAIPATAVTFTVDFYSRQQGYLNSADFSLVIGEPVIAAFTSLQNGRLTFNTSNFGVSRTLYDAAGGSNPLSQMCLMVADSQMTVYDAFPGNLDFFAADTLYENRLPASSHVVSQFQTTGSEFLVTQASSLYDGVTENNFVVLEYRVGRNYGSGISPCRLALAVDVDYLGGEIVAVDGSDLVFHNEASDRFVGIRLLPADSSFAQEISGAAYKSGGIDEQQKASLLLTGQTDVSGISGDNALVIGLSGNRMTLSGEAVIAAVLASGRSIDEIRVALQKGQEKYSQATETDAVDEVSLPSAIEVEQNYPNPFNAATTINFMLPSRGEYRFEIIDILGRTVKSSMLPHTEAGRHSIVWDGKDDAGNDVASGVYFYRIGSERNYQSRKMVLLK